jgi:glycosyltransferase involved in cell wall biosynthesis
MALLKRNMQEPPVLAVVGGQSFQDHRPYREAALRRASDSGLSMETDVKLVGTIDDSELPTWYHAADLLAFPSTSEGWGLVVLEALAAGLPAVVSDIPVFREYLTDGEGVLIAPVNDPHALASRMREILSDPALAAQLARTGPDVAARFPWSATAAQHIAAYAELRLPEVTPSRY